MKYPVRKFPIRNSLKSFIGNFILKRPVPILLSLAVTNRCNASCPFCEFWKSEPTEEMTCDETKKVFEDAYDMGCLGTLVTGGEPLLRRDLPRILEYADEAGLTTFLLTNGYLLPRRIREIHRDLDVVSVSIDFPDSRHDKIRGLKNLFERAVRGIKLAQEYGVTTNINSIITGGQTLSDVENLLSLAESLNSGITFSPIFELSEFYNQGSCIGRLSEEGERMKLKNWDLVRMIAERLLDHKSHRYRKVLQNTTAYLELIRDRGGFSCCPLSLQLSVSPTGEVGALCGLGLYGCYHLGNALNQDLEEIWRSERAEWLREKFKRCNLAREAGCYLLCVAELSLLYTRPSMILDYVKRLV
jgi:MoaA/NifB/PqqE/SkfB family radical SAM enzyme